ncbi:Phosphoglycerol transferase MdoB [Dyella jiangningensis]|uniref:LTA synthase family protein n=1 Tax=Dyella sp. AtDHG13 TaxID=1938897 RepID=UPI0008880DA1|nr:LTA synthase family protein [Dyella sp. AtDHG13]PXV59223.1 phosphoglycerol transferase MdoB-like AlkP superfamily enzyme [Dyella sp. AtDHG13]SDK26474.1 Phosphoglycerol transferase MdoB [Dyella jiangningensis]
MTPPTTRPARPARPLSARLALILALGALFTLLTGVVDGGVGVSPAQALSQPIYLIANALPGLLLATLLLVLSRRALLSFSLAFLLQTVVYAVNALKVSHLNTPLMPADFRMLGQLRRGGLKLLGSYLPASPWPYLALIAGIALIVIAWRMEPPMFARRTRGKRLVSGLALLALIGTLFAGMPGWMKIYGGHHLWLEPWSATATAEHSGLVSSLMMFHLHQNHARKKPDAAAARQLIARSDAALRERLQAPAHATGEAPDIVVVQSESFFDPSIMKGYEHADLTPNLHRLAAQGASGPLHVPTYGGGTIRTEFEVLTGLSLRYFDDLQFPYLQLNHKVVPSMVRVLRSHGYETIALHGNDPGFWNRTTAFQAIGFDRFVSRSSFPAHAAMDGQYMADSAMTDEIMAQLKNAGPPQFLFAISIEAHGPYDVPPANTAERDAIPVPEGVTGQNKLELQNYLYHMRHADQELGRLAELLAHRERPTLLLFYGDHLPALTDTYRTTGFVDGKDMLSQAGTWLLVDPRNPTPANTESLASWMLPGRLLEQAGVHDDAYFALTQVIAPQLAALTRAPGAPLEAEDHSEQQEDDDMANVALLRMKGKLDPMLPRATLQTAGVVEDAPLLPAGENESAGARQ